MRRFFAVAVVLALFPSLARGVITVRPGSYFGIRGESVAIEIFADAATLDAGVHEHLDAYTMTVSCAEFTGSDGPSFVVPANFTFDINSDPTHQYVFTAADPPFDPTSGSNRGRLFLSAAPGSADTDLSAVRNGFGKIMVFVPANARTAVYTLRIENEFLSLAGSAGTIEATGGVGTLIVAPAEPTCAGVLLAAAPVVLRRRVRART